MSSLHANQAGGVEASRSAPEVEGTSLWADAWKRLFKNKAAVAGGVVVVTMAFLALAYPLISSYVTRFTLTETHPCLRNQPPGMRGVPRVHVRNFGDEVVTFAAVDTDGDGRVTPLELSEAVARWEFAQLDRRGDGRLDVEDLRRTRRAFLTKDYAAVLSLYDEDQDGTLSFEEARAIVDIFPVSEATFYVRSVAPEGRAYLTAETWRGLPRPETFYLGTDGLGRDLATRMVYGARISLLVGLLATLVSFLIGVTWGAVAGYMGGRTDAVMMRIVDIIYGLPFMFLVILLMVIFGRNILLLFIAIGAVSWLDMARIVRGQVISLKAQEFVQSALAVGVSTPAIVFRHLIPNALGPIIVYATLTVPAVMLQEAFLSFLGLGVQPPFTSWGALANEGASTGVMLNYPWLILAPGMALAMTLLSLNFLGDGLRDALDPRMRKD